MGWCSGTSVFDAVCEGLLDEESPSRKEILASVIKALWQSDWDCEYDSDYWTHPEVRAVFKELLPDWDWADIEMNEELEKQE